MPWATSSRTTCELPRRLRKEANSQGQARRQRRALLRRVRRVSEGHRLLRPGHAGHAAGLPAPAHRGRRQGRQAPLHREAGRRRRTRHPQGARRLRGGAEEEPLRRRRHPAPPPGPLHREHEADPRRSDRRPDHGPRLLEPGATSGPTSASRAGATPSTRSATGTISSGSAATTSSSSTCTTSTSPSGPWAAHPIKAVGMGGRQVPRRARARPELRPLRGRLRVPQRRPHPEHGPADRGLRQQRLRDDRRHSKGDLEQRLPVHRRHDGPASASSTRSIRTSRSTWTCSRASPPTSRSTS